MKRLMLTAGLLALCTACPKIEKKIYHYNLADNTGSVEFINVVTDSPDKANDDFMEMVNKVIKGTKLEEDNPGWKITSKKLMEREGRLDGLVTFSFDSPAKVGLYQHDKKAPWIYCVNQEESEKLLATNGTRIDDVLTGCVAWDRKAKELEVTVKASALLGKEKSLLPQFKHWSAGDELPTSGVDSSPAGILEQIKKATDALPGGNPCGSGANPCGPI